MRFVLARLSLVLLAVSAAIASAQVVNPATQIRWPDGCDAPGMVYNVQTNTCISAIAGKVNWRGDWTAGTYATNDAVSYQGSSYISTADGNTATPPAGAWSLMASAGTPGTPGATGPTGPAGPTFDGGTIHNPLIAPAITLPAPANPYDGLLLSPSGGLLDAGYVPAWSAAAPMMTQTSTLISRLGQYLKAFHLGDSITAGSSATNCSLPFNYSIATCYVALIDNVMGIAGNQVTNEAVGGDSTPDMIWRLFTTYAGPANNTLSTIQIGTNDMAGVQRNIIPATLAIEPDLTQQWMAVEEYMSIDPSRWNAADAVCSGGGWAVDTYYASHHGCKSTTIGDVIQFPNWQSVSGEPVTVLYRVFNPAVANGGQFQTKIYHSSTGSGGPYTQVSSSIVSTTTTSAALNFINIGGPNNTSSVFSNVLSNSSTTIGPGTGVSNSGFTAVAGDWYYTTVTVLSATSGSNVVSIIGQGEGMGWAGADQSTYAAQIWRLSIPAVKQGQQYGIWSQLNADWDTATLLDQSSGFSINKDDTRNCLTGLAADYDPTNFHHPNNAGHAKLAKCALYNQTMKIPPPVASSAAAAANISGGTIVGNVAIGTTLAAGALTDQLGAVAIAPRGGIMATGQLLSFDSRTTGAATPNAAATFRGPGVAGNGHFADHIIDYYDGATVQVQTWRDIYASNQAANVVPTAFLRTLSCTTTAAACLPYQLIYNFPSGVFNKIVENNVYHEFNRTAAYAGFSFGPGSASAPTNLFDGNCWPISGDHRIHCFENSTDQTIAWASDITGASYTGEAVQVTGAFNASAGQVLAQNFVVYFSFTLPVNTSVGGIMYRITTADNTANLYDIGIYSTGKGTGSSGALLTHSGPTAGTTFAASTGIKDISMTGGAVTLLAGTYLIGVTTNAASPAVLANVPAAVVYAHFSNSGVSSTGGTLPGTAAVNSPTYTATTNIWSIALHN